MPAFSNRCQRSATTAAFDIDNDGGLNLATHTVNGPLATFANTDPAGGAITVELEGLAGIRARLQLRLANGQVLTREVQSGGGFMSFDAPRAHFGLGAVDHAESLEIHWRTGPPTLITGPIAAGMRYRVQRDAE